MGLVFYDLPGTPGLAGVRLRLSTQLMSAGVLICMPYCSMLAYTADQARTLKEAVDGCVGRPGLLVVLALLSC